MINIKYWLCFEQESNDPLNVEDKQQPIEDHASNLGNEFIHMLQFYIKYCKWWTLIVLLHISTVEHVKGHIVQVEPRQEYEVHDVATSSKKTPL